MTCPGTAVFPLPFGSGVGGKAPFPFPAGGAFVVVAKTAAGGGPGSGRGLGKFIGWNICGGSCRDAGTTGGGPLNGGWPAVPKCCS